MLLTILWNIILPVFVVIALGFIVQRVLALDVKPLSRVLFYVLSPCLVFSSLSVTPVGGSEAGRIAAFGVISFVIMGLVVWGVSRVMRLGRAMESAFLLVTLFVNAGNYGLPVNQFAFGDEGFARAMIYFVTSAVLTNTVGVYLASRGKASGLRAVSNVLKVPLVYAVAVALAVNWSRVSVPSPLFKATDLLGRAAVPLMLLLLGMQLARTSLTGNLRLITVATGLRLLLGPLVAFCVAGALQLAGLARQASITEFSMPTAVMALILALEFDLEPDFVTGTVFVSTMVSIVTLTVLLSVLL